MALLTSLFQLLPHQCPLCLERCNDYLCPSCQGSLPRIAKACPTCALPLAAAANICGDCLKLEKPYRHTLCPLAYRHPVDHLLREFKERRPLVAARALLPPLLQRLDDHYRGHPLPQALVPVPMHWSKRLRRGFNQAQVLSHLLSEHTGVPTRPLLHRSERARNQKGLGRKQRLRNLRHAFACDSELNGLRVAIVDDVITTCATAMAAADTLIAAGAGSIDLWALARTPSK